MDDTELTESLPSESAFVSRGPVRGSHDTAGGLKASKDFSPISATDYINASTPGSDMMEQGTPGAAKPSGGTPSSGKKPFLRKGSRKEPSALNRVQARASPITTSSSSKGVQSDGMSASRPNPSSSFTKGKSRNHGGGDGGKGGEFEVEVLAKPPPPSRPRQSQNSSVDAPMMNSPQKTTTMGAAAVAAGDGGGVNALNSSPGSVSSDPNETSGTFEVEWKTLHEKRTQSLRELDEFAVLEQQLEGMPTMLGANDDEDDDGGYGDRASNSRSAPPPPPPRPVTNTNVDASRGLPHPNPQSRFMDTIDAEDDDDDDQDGGARGDELKHRDRYSIDHEMYDEEETGIGVVNQSPPARRPLSSYSATEVRNESLPPRPTSVSAPIDNSNGVRSSYQRNSERGKDKEMARQERERALLGYDDEEDDDDDTDEGHRHALENEDDDEYYSSSMRSSRDSAGNGTGTRMPGIASASRGVKQKLADNHRGRGVHNEGGTMSGLLDHSKGPMINRPRSSYSSSSGKGGAGRKRGGEAETGTGTGSEGRSGRAASPSGPLSQTQAQAQAQALQASLREKAVELERELATYKAENLKVKAMKRQQEASAADMARQKAEVAKWCDEEKTKCDAFVTEQKKIAARERRNASKVASDARREGNAQSARKTVADMEVLEATNARLKGEAEAGAKKARMTERRLQTLVKDQTSTIDELRGRVTNLEGTVTALRAYCEKVGVRIPTSVARGSHMKPSGSRAKSGLKSSPVISTSASAGAGRPKVDMWRTTSYVEEVSLPGAGADVIADIDDGDYENNSAGAALLRERDAPAGALSSAIFGSTDAGDGDGEEPSGVGSLNMASGEYHPGRYTSSPAKRNNTSQSYQGYYSYNRSGASINEDGDREAEAEAEEASMGLGTMHMRLGQEQRSSWARSSGGSSSSRSGANRVAGAGGRYSTDGDTFDDDEEVNSNEIDGESDGGTFRLPPSSTGVVDARTSAAVANSSLDFSSTEPASHSSRPHRGSGGSGGGSGSGRTEETLPDGRRLVRYRNGTVKEVYPNGGRIVVRFVNGDTKSTEADGTVVYFYCDADTTHTTRKDGCEIYQFPNGQTERHYPDGLKEIRFPDETRKVIYPSGVTESVFPDGRTVKEFPESGEKVFTGADGKVETLSGTATIGTAGRG